jgi:outer membrane protein OmpA-like peptidoglycan-associated protein
MISMRSTIIAALALAALSLIALALPVSAQTNAPNRDHPKQMEFAAAAAGPQAANARNPVQGDTYLFPFEKTYLTKEQVEMVKRSAAWLKAHPDIKVRLECHTDDDMGVEDALVFGDTRCRTVETWLIKNGISAARISARSFGNSRPAVAQGGDRAKNRRVVIKLAD